MNCFYCAPFGDALPEVHTLRKPTTQPTKLAKESEVVSNGYLLGNRPLNINVFLDCFSAYCSLAQNNRGIAGNIDNGRRWITCCLA
jgi:hypothetical protein